jgi:hypothetical protein
MAISNMQQARQLRAGGGIMDLEPRQGYFLGKLVKKVTRPLKKIAKSPLGKAAMIGAGAYFAPKLFGGTAGFGKGSTIGNFFRSGAGKGIGSFLGRGLDKFKGLSTGQQLLLGGGALATALPFMLGGGEEEEEIVDTFEKTPGTITDIVAQAKARSPSLRFLPQNAYTQSGFFNAADGGIARTSYAIGGPTEDVMVENVDTQEVVSAPDPMAELNMLSIELFGKPLDQLNETERGQLQELISSRMQEQAGNRVMAESGGMMDYMSSANPMAESYLMEDKDIVNMYRPGGERQMAAEGGIMDKRGLVDGPGGYAGKKGKKKPMNIAEMTNYDNMGPLYAIGQSMALLPYIMAMKDGGRIPAQEGGIMDLGGMEKDYRNEGGFVPIGGKERADDVPARLSKNEFVFTADAVRNAGGGDIDKGAEVMENLMNNLEQGGEVSEESQGNPAQEMFDTAQMLEGRIA